MRHKTIWNLLILTIFCLLLTSCNDRQEKTDEPNDTKLIANTEGLQFYSETAYPLPGGYTIVGMARLDNRLLLAGNGEDGAVLGFVDYSLTDTGRVTLSETQLVDLEGPDVTVYGVAAGGDGYFHVLTGARENGDLEQGNFSLLCYSQEMEKQESVPLVCDPDARMDGVQVGFDGEIVLYGGIRAESKYVHFVSLFSAQGDLVHTELLDGRLIYSSALCAEGVVFSGDTTRNKSFYKSFYALLDSRNGTLTDLDISTVEAGTGCSQSNCQGLNGEYIIDTGKRYLEYNLQTNECRELLWWTDGSISDLLNTCRLGEYALACYTGGDALYLLGMEPAEIGERSVVNVALVDMSDHEVESFMRKINQNSELYEYRLSGCYTSYSDDGIKVDRLLTEIVTGRAPDLVLMHYNVSINTDSDFFEDLYPYIDADETLSRDSFIPNLLQALSRNGELHQLWEAVDVRTFAARVSDVGDGRGLTPADYNRIVAENPQYQAVFERAIGRDYLLGWISGLGKCIFVDRENAACNFDNPAFRDLLAWCGDMGDDLPEGSPLEPYEPSEVVMMYEPLSNVSISGDGDDGRRYLINMERRTGEPCVFVGFPNGGNGFSYYENSYENVAMAIPTQSKNKEGAWAFIHERLSMDHQMERGAYSYVCGLPVLDAAMRRRAEAELSTGDAGKLYALMESIQYAETFNSKSLTTIIQEVGQAYLAGDKTLDEAVALIQSRASLWVSEQYG